MIFTLQQHDVFIMHSYSLKGGSMLTNHNMRKREISVSSFSDNPIFDNPSKNTPLIAAHHFQQMANMEGFDHRQVPSERDDISQLG